MVQQSIGERVLRKEDQRFITGKGKFTDDINIRGQAYAYFVRSPVAHAVVNSIDVSAAEAAVDVVAVLTGIQVADDGLGALPCGWVPGGQAGGEVYPGSDHIGARPTWSPVRTASAVRSS